MKATRSDLLALTRTRADELEGSRVWDDPFAGEQEAPDEALRVLDEDPLEFMVQGGTSPMN